LPKGFEATQLRGRDGVDHCYVGAVVFRDLDFRFSAVPWLRFRMGQTNYRAYVRHGNQDVAWFFGATLSRPFVTIPRLLWRLPWAAARFHFDCTWNDKGLREYRMEAKSVWAPAELVASGTGRHP